MPFIQNISIADTIAGVHRPAGGNAMLIRILDLEDWDVKDPAHPFNDVRVFRFDDLTADWADPAKFARRGPRQEHADDILLALSEAHERGMNVIVHCRAGVARSGAVSLVGELVFGFDAVGSPRNPNSSLVAMMLRSHLVEVRFVGQL
jgi:predicted protein tyrosine phosphatase